MKKKRIFIVNQADDSQGYGVGKYINELIEEAKIRSNDFDIVSILVGDLNVNKIEKNQIDNITYFKIPSMIINRGYTSGLSYLYSKAVFILLNEFYQFGKTDTFHFNSNRLHFLLECIKEHTNASIMYTIHVSLWKEYYNNDFNRFVSEFKDAKKESPSIDNINIEIKNCALSDRVVCLSDGMNKVVLDIYGIPDYKVFNIPNGIREQKFNVQDLNEVKQIKENLNIAEKDFVFLYMGRLTPQKGVAQLITSFKNILQADHENVKLLIIGDGQLRESLIKECYGIKDIIFTGYVSPYKVKLYYKLANALIFPSLNEQSSYVMLEAMSFKLPMIVTDTDIFEMLKNEYSCLKISLGESKELDLNSFEDKIILMLKRKELRKQIAKNSYNLYVEKYSSKTMFDSTYLVEEKQKAHY